MDLTNGMIANWCFFVLANWGLVVRNSRVTLWWHNSACSLHDIAGTADHSTHQWKVGWLTVQISPQRGIAVSKPLEPVGVSKHLQDRFCQLHSS